MCDPFRLRLWQRCDDSLEYEEDHPEEQEHHIGSFPARMEKTATGGLVDQQHECPQPLRCTVVNLTAIDGNIEALTSCGIYEGCVVLGLTFCQKALLGTYPPFHAAGHDDGWGR